MTEIVVRLDHELVDALATEAGDDGVERFVERAVRHELDRTRGQHFLDHLDHELGPVDDALIERFDALFEEADSATGAA